MMGASTQYENPINVHAVNLRRNDVIRTQLSRVLARRVTMKGFWGVKCNVQSVSAPCQHVLPRFLALEALWSALSSAATQRTAKLPNGLELNSRPGEEALTRAIATEQWRGLRLLSVVYEEGLAARTRRSQLCLSLHGTWQSFIVDRTRAISKSPLNYWWRYKYFLNIEYKSSPTHSHSPQCLQAARVLRRNPWTQSEERNKILRKQHSDPEDTKFE